MTVQTPIDFFRIRLNYSHNWYVFEVELLTYNV